MGRPVNDHIQKTAENQTHDKNKCYDQKHSPKYTPKTSPFTSLLEALHTVTQRSVVISTGRGHRITRRIDTPSYCRCIIS